MPTKRKSTRATPKVGSTVRFRFGITPVTAKVIEDRGPLGRDGEHLLRVRFQFKHADPTETEIAASRVTVVRGAA